MARKITRATLDELVKEMPPLTEQEQRGCVGGGSGTINDPYSESELDYMLKSYSWSGGYVFFNGTTTYVADDAVIYGEGGRSGLEDFYSLINSYVGGAADGISSLQQGQYGQVTSRFARYGGGLQLLWMWLFYFLKATRMTMIGESGLLQEAVCSEVFLEVS